MTVCVAAPGIDIDEEMSPPNRRVYFSRPHLYTDLPIL
jgi:hypothetical protein